MLAFGHELLLILLTGADADSALWSMRKHADLELWRTPGRQARLYLLPLAEAALRPALQRVTGASRPRAQPLLSLLYDSTSISLSPKPLQRRVLPGHQQDAHAARRLVGVSQHDWPL